jgi:iron complex outermembrane recepter protein
MNYKLSYRLAMLAICLAVPWVVGTQAAHAEQAIEEVVVTGSYIRGTPEDAASPVDVIDRAEMDAAGTPNVLEMLRNLGPSAGIDGETNQFQSNGLEGVSNVNLRGLGPARTLVLLNGKRMQFSPYGIAETGQLFVNTNAIPAIALERLELLKDGASATYGSDAVAGVVNFITRSNFRGVEFMGSYKDMDDNDDGNIEGGFIVGFGTDTLDVVASVGYQSRGEVAARDKDWAMETSPAQNPRGGFSGIPNPSRFLALDAGGNVTGLFNDPDCTTVGGKLNGTACNFRFTDFDNISEEEEHLQVFIETTLALNDAWSLGAEVLYSNDDVPEWKTSPSYPPQSLFSADRYVGPGMPHFDDFIARNPSLAATFAGGAQVLGRTFGVSGPAQVGNREYDSYRFAVDLTGSFDNGIEMTTSLTYGTSEGERNTNDTAIDRLAFAYRGLGGPNCDIDAGVPGSGNLGTGDCFYYNPFTSGYATSMAAGFEGVASPGGDDATLNNPAFMQNWLTDPIGTTVETQLLVFDLVFSGESDVVAGGGNVAWAAGVQYRREDFEVDPNQFTDLDVQPCGFGLQPGESFSRGVDGFGLPFTFDCPSDPSSITGNYHFLAGTRSSDLDQDIFALFGELQVPLAEDLEVQLAVRYEDYGGAVGSTLDPKVAVRWDANEMLTFRGSLGSSFRGPGLNQLQGRGTSLQFVPPTGAFKAIDTSGNPDLSPESAIMWNLGVVFQPTENIFATLDWWSFDFSDPIVIEPAGDIVTVAFDPNADPNAQAEALSKLVFQDPANPTGPSVQRVNVQYENGPDVETDGIDYKLEYVIPSDAGEFMIGVQGTYVLSYDVDSWIWADSFEAEGKLNRFTYVRPLPEWKNNFYVNWSMGGHNLRLEHWFTDEYEDADAPAGADWDIDSHNTFDLHYNYVFNAEQTRIFASVVNLTDEDPPFARLDLNYDPYTHNPFGRTFKVGFQHRFEGGLFE